MKLVVVNPGEGFMRSLAAINPSQMPPTMVRPAARS
jgi:hypothetical protein